jgi:hypothetical protein
MKIVRNVFYNKRNNQASITIPIEKIKQYQFLVGSKNPPKKLTLEILSPKEVKDLKRL